MLEKSCKSLSAVVIFLYLIFSLPVSAGTIEPLVFNPFAEVGDNFTIEIHQSQGFPARIWLWIDGPLRIGDASKMIAAIKKVKPEGADPFHSKWLIVWVSSPGGSLGEAIKLGRYLRKESAVTGVPGKGKCNSSCIFILVSGISRILGMKAEVGVHRPYLVEAEPDLNFEAEYQKNYRTVMNYLKEMHISSALGELMFAIPPDQIKTLTRDEFGTLIGHDDPVFDEADIARSAHGQRITSSEYRKRKKLSDEVCFRLLNLEQLSFSEISDVSKKAYEKCVNDILQGKIAPE